MANEEILAAVTSPASAFARRLAQSFVLRPLVRAVTTPRFHGGERLRRLKGPFVVVGNHASHLDTALVYAALPGRLARRLATGAAADHFFADPRKSVIPRLFFNVFPVDRPGKLLRGRTHQGLSGQLLDAGVPLLIFPEGTRSRDGVMRPFTAGVARLCTSRRLPCVPAALVGTHQAWPAGKRLWRRGRPPVHVTFGEPMLPRRGELAAVFALRVQQEVLRLHDLTAQAHGLPTMKQIAGAAVRRALPGRRRRRTD